MKYVAILTYTTGSTSGVTIEADNVQEAWRKLMVLIPTEHLKSVEVAEIPSPNYEIKK